MKYTIDTTSWHFWIACFLNDEDEVRRKKTICNYRWSVIFGFMRFAIVFSIATVGVLVPMSIAILHFFLTKMWSSVAVEVCSVISIIEVSVVLGIFLFIALCQWYSAWKEKRDANETLYTISTPKTKKEKKVKQPGFVSTSWKSLKDKYCLPVDFDG